MALPAWKGPDENPIAKLTAEGVAPLLDLREQGAFDPRLDRVRVLHELVDGAVGAGDDPVRRAERLQLGLLQLQLRVALFLLALEDAQRFAGAAVAGGAPAVRGRGAMPWAKTSSPS